MVGLHGDEDVEKRRGAYLPIMNVHERALSVLACKYVDEVIIGAPVVVNDYLMKTFNISMVVRGSISETSSNGPVEEDRWDEGRVVGVAVEWGERG
jgi:ethanolamine-phosphate cytidylyltransferase